MLYGLLAGIVINGILMAVANESGTGPKVIGMSSIVIAGGALIGLIIQDLI